MLQETPNSTRNRDQKQTCGSSRPTHQQTLLRQSDPSSPHKLCDHDHVQTYGFNSTFCYHYYPYYHYYLNNVVQDNYQDSSLHKFKGMERGSEGFPNKHHIIDHPNLIPNTASHKLYNNSFFSYIRSLFPNTFIMTSIQQSFQFPSTTTSRWRKSSKDNRLGLKALTLMSLILMILCQTTVGKFPPRTLHSPQPTPMIVRRSSNALRQVPISQNVMHQRPMPHIHRRYGLRSRPRPPPVPRRSMPPPPPPRVRRRPQPLPTHFPRKPITSAVIPQRAILPRNVTLFKSPNNFLNDLKPEAQTLYDIRGFNVPLGQKDSQLRFLNGFGPHYRASKNGPAPNSPSNNGNNRKNLAHTAPLVFPSFYQSQQRPSRESIMKQNLPASGSRISIFGHNQHLSQTKFEPPSGSPSYSNRHQEHITGLRDNKAIGYDNSILQARPFRPSTVDHGVSQKIEPPPRPKPILDFRAPGTRSNINNNNDDNRHVRIGPSSFEDPEPFVYLYDDEDEYSDEYEKENKEQLNTNKITTTRPPQIQHSTPTPINFRNKLPSLSGPLLEQRKPERFLPTHAANPPYPRTKEPTLRFPGSKEQESHRTPKPFLRFPSVTPTPNVEIIPSSERKPPPDQSNAVTPAFHYTPRFETERPRPLYPTTTLAPQFYRENRVSLFTPSDFPRVSSFQESNELDEDDSYAYSDKDDSSPRLRPVNTIIPKERVPNNDVIVPLNYPFHRAPPPPRTTTTATSTTTTTTPTTTQVPRARKVPSPPPSPSRGDILRAHPGSRDTSFSRLETSTRKSPTTTSRRPPFKLRSRRPSFLSRFQTTEKPSTNSANSEPIQKLKQRPKFKRPIRPPSPTRSAKPLPPKPVRDYYYDNSNTDDYTNPKYDYDVSSEEPPKRPERPRFPSNALTHNSISIKSKEEKEPIPTTRLTSIAPPTSPTTFSPKRPSFDFKPKHSFGRTTNRVRTSDRSITKTTGKPLYVAGKTLTKEGGLYAGQDITLNHIYGTPVPETVVVPFQEKGINRRPSNREKPSLPSPPVNTAILREQPPAGPRTRIITLKSPSIPTEKPAEPTPTPEPLKQLIIKEKTPVRRKQRPRLRRPLKKKQKIVTVEASVSEANGAQKPGRIRGRGRPKKRPQPDPSPVNSKEQSINSNPLEELRARRPVFKRPKITSSRKEEPEDTNKVRRKEGGRRVRPKFRRPRPEESEVSVVTQSSVKIAVRPTETPRKFSSRFRDASLEESYVTTIHPFRRSQRPRTSEETTQIPDSVRLKPTDVIGKRKPARRVRPDSISLRLKSLHDKQQQQEHTVEQSQSVEYSSSRDEDSTEPKSNVPVRRRKKLRRRKKNGARRRRLRTKSPEASSNENKSFLDAQASTTSHVNAQQKLLEDPKPLDSKSSYAPAQEKSDIITPQDSTTSDESHSALQFTSQLQNQASQERRRSGERRPVYRSSQESQKTPNERHSSNVNPLEPTTWRSSEALIRPHAAPAQQLFEQPEFDSVSPSSPTPSTVSASISREVTNPFHSLPTSLQAETTPQRNQPKDSGTLSPKLRRLLSALQHKVPASAKNTQVTNRPKKFFTMATDQPLLPIESIFSS